MAVNEFELAEAYTEFTVRDAEFQKGLAKVQRSLERTKARMRAVARAAKLMFIAGAAALVVFVKEAADAEELIDKFNAVFKENASEVKKWAEAYAEAAGRSKFELMDMAAGLQSLIGPMGVVGEEGILLAERLTQAAQDIGSFENVRAADVLVAIRAGLIGSSEPLQRFSIDVRDAAVSQELLRMGIEGGKKAATEQQLVLARYNIILDKSQQSWNNAIDTQGSLTNQVIRLKAKWQDLAVEIGTTLIPIVKELVMWIGSHTESIKIAIFFLVDFIKTHAITIIKIIAVIAAVKLFIGILHTLTIMFEAATAAQAILHAFSGPKGWALLAAGAVAAAGAVFAVSKAYDAVTDSAEAAQKAAEEANTEAEKAAKEGMAGKKKQRLTASGLPFPSSGMPFRRNAAPPFPFDRPPRPPEGNEPEAVKKEKEIKQLNVSPVSGGAVDITQLQARFQADTIRRDQEKMKWAKDTAMTLQEMHKEGITIANLDDFNPAFWEK